MFQFLLIVQVLVSASIIGLVMIQQGKGADMGAAFGSGTAGTVFGARGGGSFLTRATAILAVAFFVNCLLIASPLIRDKDSSEGSIAGAIEQQATEQAGKAKAADEALQTGSPEATVEKAEIADTEGDLPDVPDAPPTEAGTGDLPE
jgi:preprotein translocase subunit SecG